MANKAGNSIRPNQLKKQSICFFVLGMYRSGTSALARIVSLLGAAGINLHTPKPAHQADAPSSATPELVTAAPVTATQPAAVSASYMDIVRTAAHVSGGWRNLPRRALRVFRTGGLSAVRHRIYLARQKAQARLRIQARYKGTASPTAMFAMQLKPTWTKKMLFIDWSTPQPDRDAGSLAAFHMMQIFVNLGYDVTFFPSDLENLGSYTENLRTIGVRCLDGGHFSSIREHLAAEGTHYSTVVICRAPLAQHHIDDIRIHAPKAKIVLHTSDLHYLREIREAELAKCPKRLAVAEANKQYELETIAKCDVTIVVSPVELKLLRDELPGANIQLVPLLFVDMVSDCPDFDARRDIVFIGGFPHLPNVDAVLYFAREIFPKIRAELPDVIWHIVGDAPPPDVLALNKIPGIKVHGFVHDISGIFSRTRLSVAPLRYGAGIKGKLTTSLSYGVPAVATAIAVEGMDIADGEHVLVADGPDDFAAAVVRLYRSKELWTSMSTAGRNRMVASYSVPAGHDRLTKLMAGIDPDFRRLDMFDVRSKGSYDLLRTYLAKHLDERRAIEIGLIRRDRPSFAVEGFCAACGSESEFSTSMVHSYETTSDGKPIPNWREHLDCQGCGLQNRLRAAMHFFYLQFRPDPNASIYITEQASALYAMLKARHPNLVGSEFLGGSVPLGHMHNELRNEDPTRLTFPDRSFDYILSFDVMEHVGDDIAALSSMYRCLKPGGRLLFAAPFDQHRSKKLVRAKLHADGTIEHLLPPEYHGDPVDPENGLLCFRYFAWDLVDDMTRIGFKNARVMHYWSHDYAYLGGEQFIFMAERPD